MIRVLGYESAKLTGLRKMRQKVVIRAKLFCTSNISKSLSFDSQLGFLLCLSDCCLAELLSYHVAETFGFSMKTKQKHLCRFVFGIQRNTVVLFAT